MTTKIWARIDSGAVVEMIPLDSSLVPGVDVYTKAVAATMIDATSVAGVVQGWTYANGAFAAPPAPPAPTTTQLLAWASAYQNSLLSQVWAFNVGTTAKPVWLTTKLDDRGQASMTQLLVWASVALSTDTEPYSNVDYTSTTINALQARSLALTAGAAKSSTYTALNNIAAAIMATPPTITTYAQIRAANWPVPTTAS